MILRLAGGIFIVICGSLCGIYLSVSIARKAEFISQYITFLSNAEAMICFSRADIYKIISEQSNLTMMNRMLDDVRAALEDGGEFSSAWSSAVSKACERREFEKEELPLIQSFAEGFGELGAEEESARLSLIRNSAQKRMTEINEELSRRKKLYRTLGTFCGMLAAVIII